MMHRINRGIGYKAHAALGIPLVMLMSAAVNADTAIWRAIPGTSTPDQRGPVAIERDGVIYPAIKGTQTPDYGADDRRIIRDGKVYDVIPGTNTPDYGSGTRLLKER